MKKTTLFFSILFAASLFASSDNYTLTVKANGFKNNQGKVQFSLYNKDGTIPDKNLDQYFMTKRVTLKNGQAEATFSALPKGRYAISFYHDENSNHQIDKGLIMPEEGVGLSNFDTINFFNLPNFKAASFELDEDTTRQMNVIYF